MDNKEQAQAKRNRAYDLRLKGHTYREIGARLEVSHVTARKWVTEYLADETLPLVEEVRKHEYDRMMTILERLDDRASEGDDKALVLMLKVSESLRKMLGADMPTQVQVEKTETSSVDLAIMDLIARQKAANELSRAEAASRRTVEKIVEDS